MRNLASLLFAGGLAFLLLVIAAGLDFGAPPMPAGQAILDSGPAQTGAANIVTSVVLGYRGFDTLGELSILFAAATAAGLVLGRRRPGAPRDPQGGMILRVGGDLLFPLLLVVGFYIVLHGHLTPGGGFQGGVILTAAFFVAILANPERHLSHLGIVLFEGLAGASFIGIGLWAMWQGDEFMKPLLGTGVMGELLSGQTLPLLYLAVGIKVGAELAGLLAEIADTEACD